MEVQIISKETIKPSSPTPHHLRAHKLSLLDQIIPPIYIPVLLFYSATIESPSRRSLQLKESLSKTLTHFYTFAGRRPDDNLTIDCNDEGATFIEAQVTNDMSVVLNEPEIDLLQQLVPSGDENPPDESSSAKVLLAIQVNYFACGGMAIGVSVNHVVADASTVATFLQSWAGVVCGNSIADAVTFDCSSLFPPRDLTGYWRALKAKGRWFLLEDVATNRFSFDGSKIAVLRDEIGKNSPSSYRPTRVEAVSALIWNAMLASTAENDKSPIFVATTVNLRKRINLPFSRKCNGNVGQLTMTELLTEKTKNLSTLAMKIHDSIANVDDEFVRKLHVDGGYVEIMENAMKGFEENWLFTFSIWCRFPFYEIDFGWGKPIWFVTTVRANKFGLFLDSSDGEGIEARITLNREEMVKLEQDSGMLAYATFRPNT